MVEQICKFFFFLNPNANEIPLCGFKGWREQDELLTTKWKVNQQAGQMRSYSRQEETVEKVAESTQTQQLENTFPVCICLSLAMTDRTESGPRNLRTAKER